ncbi:hypothetical protein ABZ678_29805 [Streptomyces hirsutus]|uniref:hypothetical protein n=1 Tax=Streptomyces hirsutus TaxID=35620 RepID=UPI0033CDB5EA
MNKIFSRLGTAVIAMFVVGGTAIGCSGGGIASHDSTPSVTATLTVAKKPALPTVMEEFTAWAIKNAGPQEKSAIDRITYINSDLDYMEIYTDHANDDHHSGELIAAAFARFKNNFGVGLIRVYSVDEKRIATGSF